MRGEVGDNRSCYEYVITGAVDAPPGPGGCQDSWVWDKPPNPGVWAEPLVPLGGEMWRTQVGQSLPRVMGITLWLLGRSRTGLPEAVSPLLRRQQLEFSYGDLNKPFHVRLL